MDKKELKSDIIREKIADAITYIKNNSKRFLYSFVFVILAIGLYIYNSNNNQKIIDSEKEKTSTVINQIETFLRSTDTYKQKDGDSTILISPSHPRRQNFIQDSLLVIINSMPENDIQSLLLYMHSIKSLDLENLESFIKNYPIDNDAEMLIYLNNLSKVLLETDNDKKIQLLKECIDSAPSYDLKVYRTIDLVDLYININKIEDAYTIISNCFDYIDKLSFNAKNELNENYGKIKMLNK